MRSAVPVFITVCGAAIGAWSQNDAVQQPQFRAGVELVHLDVSVRDQAGRSVRGLAASDFTVLIDGRREPVVAFKAVNPEPGSPAPAARWLRDVAPDVATNTRSSGRVIAILIDDQSFSETAIGLAGVRRARETALAIVDELGPDDNAAVVFTDMS